MVILGRWAILWAAPAALAPGWAPEPRATPEAAYRRAGGNSNFPQEGFG